MNLQRAHFDQDNKRINNGPFNRSDKNLVLLQFVPVFARNFLKIFTYLSIELNKKNERNLRRTVSSLLILRLFIRTPERSIKIFERFKLTALIRTGFLSFLEYIKESRS